MPINDPTELPVTDLFWLRSDLGRTVTSGRVTDWANQGDGTGRDLTTGGNTATHPTDVTVGGFPAVQCAAGQTIFNTGFTTNFSGITAQTMVLVFADSGGGANTTDLFTGRVPFTLQQNMTEAAGGYGYTPFNQAGGASGVTGLARAATTIGWYIFESANGTATTGENSDGDTVTAGAAIGQIRDTFGRLDLNGAQKQWLEIIYFDELVTGSDRTDLIDYLNDRYFPASGALESTASVASTSSIAINTETIQESTAAIAGTSSIAIATETIQEATFSVDGVSALSIAVETILESTMAIDSVSALAIATDVPADNSSTTSIDGVSDLSIATERIRETAAAIAGTSSLDIATAALLSSTFSVDSVSDISIITPAEITANLPIDGTSDLAIATDVLLGFTADIAALSDIVIATETIQEATFSVDSSSAIAIQTEGGGEVAPAVERDVDGPPAPYKPSRKRKLSKNQQRARERERLRREAEEQEADERDAMQAIQVLLQTGVI